MHQLKLVDSKTLANEVCCLKWNPRMDLLATVFTNGSLTLTRLLSWQKVWHREKYGEINSVCWRPDGRVLAIASYNSKTKENACTLHDVENGKVLHTINAEKQITSVSWYQYEKTDEKNYDGTFQSKDDDCSANPLLSIISQLNTFQADAIVNPYTSSTNDSFCHQLSKHQTKLNLLILATIDGELSFYALGLYYVGRMCRPDAVGQSYKIVDTHMSSCLRYLTLIMQAEHARNNISVSLRTLAIEHFQSRNQEILSVAQMYSKILAELEYLDDTINGILTCWEDVLAGLDSKLCFYRSRKTKVVQSAYGGYTFLGADELLQLLANGEVSDNLEKFLTDMSEKGLKKLNQAIEQTCLRVQNLVVQKAKKCCHHLHDGLNRLKGLSLSQVVGLEDKYIIEAMKSVGSLIFKLIELQEVIDHSLKSAKAFFKWLISKSLKLNNEQGSINNLLPDENAKNFRVNIQLISDFIMENFDYNSSKGDGDEYEDTTSFGDSCQMKIEDSNAQSITSTNDRPTCSNFTLEQIGQYFKDEPLTRLRHSFTKKGTNLCIDFICDRPELTDLNTRDDEDAILNFYPHKPHSSLIQEYNNAKQSIMKAFNCLADNISSLLEQQDTCLNLKDFIRNVQLKRVDVEMDSKLNLHHTIFLTRNTDCMYLLSCCLSSDIGDKTFRLLKIICSPKTNRSIELTDSSETVNTSTSSSHSIKPFHICDLDFFTPSVISLLLTDSHDSFIVQVSINYLFDLLADRSQHYKLEDVSDALKNIKSIESYCQTINLTLDVYGPIQSREQTSGLIVKRIKSTVGKDAAVCGTRRVVAFTSASNKRVSLYELEPSETDDLEDDEGEGEVEKNHWTLDETL